MVDLHRLGGTLCYEALARHGPAGWELPDRHRRNSRRKP